MSANFVDVMLIDADTVSFLLTVFPGLAAKVGAAAGSALPLLALFWWLDPFRVRLRIAALGAVGCLAALSALSLAVPMDREKAFESADYVSQFARSGTRALFDLATRGLLESDSAVRRSSFVGRARGLQAGAAAAAHRSRARRVELRHQRRAGRQGAGRLSKPLPFVRWQGAHVPRRRRGRADLVHRIQRAERTFGALLRPFRRVRDADRRRARHAEPAERAAQLRLSTPTASIPGSARSSARAISRRRSASITSTTPRTSKTRDVEPDEFYYAFTADLLKRDHAQGPMFVFTYLMANHFPWTYRYRDELLAGLARSRQWRRERPSHRRISAPAGHERARLQGVHRAAANAISRTSRS